MIIVILLPVVALVTIVFPGVSTAKPRQEGNVEMNDRNVIILRRLQSFQLLGMGAHGAEGLAVNVLLCSGAR